jgi:hypothetical protein
MYGSFDCPSQNMFWWDKSIIDYWLFVFHNKPALLLNNFILHQKYKLINLNTYIYELADIVLPVKMISYVCWTNKN